MITAIAMLAWLSAIGLPVPVWLWVLAGVELVLRILYDRPPPLAYDNRILKDGRDY